MPNYTTYIDIDAATLNCSIQQQEPYAYYNNNGYEHLYLNIRRCDGLVLPLYCRPYDAWYDYNTYAIYLGNISMWRINYIKCFPTVLAFLRSLWVDNHDYYIYTLHLIDPTGSGQDDHTTRYMASTPSTNTQSKNVYINNFICEAMINDLDDFKDVFKNLCGSNQNVAVKNSMI